VIECFVMAGLVPAMTSVFGARTCVSSNPEDRESQDQQHQEDHDEDIEQDTRDICRCHRYPGEAEDAGDDRYQEKDQRPFQNRHRPFSTCARTGAERLSKSPGLTSVDGTGSLEAAEGGSHPIAGRAVPARYWTLLNRVPGGNIVKKDALPGKRS
jgi:hypothetical protein